MAAVHDPPCPLGSGAALLMQLLLEAVVRDQSVVGKCRWDSVRLMKPSVPVLALPQALKQELELELKEMDCWALERKYWVGWVVGWWM